MKSNVINKICALLLIILMCTATCGDITVNAKEFNDGEILQEEVEEQSDENGLEESEGQGGYENEEEETEEIRETEAEISKISETDMPEETERLNDETYIEEEEDQKLTEQSIQTIETKSIRTSGLSNPKVVKDSNMESGQVVTWDCVWFGSYPQAEVVPSKEAYNAISKELLRDNDLVEDSSLYSTLQNATGWDSYGDIIVNGIKYRRMRGEDATYAESEDGYYDWSDPDTYHYFKYEPIKWRVLKVDGNQMFLLSDILLDEQKYHLAEEDITWETSTIRSWLNGYSASYNEQEIDYSSRKNFASSAFSPAQKADIINTSVVNDKSIGWSTDGGNDTIDKIFLMSEAEMYGESSASYGFVPTYRVHDEARRCVYSSTYSKAMGTMAEATPIFGGNFWWLRSPGLSFRHAAEVDGDGSVDYEGGRGADAKSGVRVALNLSLLSTEWNYAGTVSSDGAVVEEDRRNDQDISTNTPTKDDNSKITQNVSKKQVKVSKIKISGISKKIAAGKKIKLTANISPSNAANKAVTWKSSNTKVATVNSSGTVTMKKSSGGKSVTITATAKDGSGVKATYKITSMKGIVKKVAVSGGKSVKTGKTLKLKAKVTASKKANTKLRWTSSNKKYATVNSSGKVKALKAGKGKKVKITAQATDGSGKKKTVTIKIK